MSYETEQFVNKVIEYETGHFLAVAWDNNKYIFIDHTREVIEQIIMHPSKDNYSVRCWGLELVPDFDLKRCPFVLARDNIGLVLINVSKKKAFLFMDLPISVNLFGHGEILRLLRSQSGNIGLTTIVQKVNSDEAILVKVELPRDF